MDLLCIKVVMSSFLLAHSAVILMEECNVMYNFFFLISWDIVKGSNWL